MLRFFHVRPVNLLGILGATLVIIGFFLPCRIEVSTGIFAHFAPFYPAGTVVTDSFWQMLVNTIQGVLQVGASALPLPLPLESLIIGAFLLSMLLPLGYFLGAFLGRQKQTLLFFSLILAIFGFLEFLFWSALLLLAFSTVALTRTAGPGFWLMLIGYPLSIGSALREGITVQMKRSAPIPS